MPALRSRLLLFALGASCATTPPPAAPVATPNPRDVAIAAPARKGIELADLDRAADPCTDFYAFANGTWRKNNPIPASMDRWSRRWQAGENNKQLVNDLLFSLAAKSDWPKGSVEQLLSDHYAACTDEARINEAGAKPLEPLLASIAAIKTPAQVQAVLRQFHAMGFQLPFGFGAQPDQHAPTQTIAIIAAGGLGLPDRDYYLKPEPRFAEAREAYKAHVTKMLLLLGRPEKVAKASAETVFAFEKRLAEASLDNVALRDPKATDHPMTVEALAALTPHFSWVSFFDDGQIAKVPLIVEQPAFLKAFDRELEKTPVAVWREYLTWHLVDFAAPFLSAPFEKQNFEFYEKYLGGVAEMKPRWKRCSQWVDAQLGEALGQKYVEKHFPPAAKARAVELVRNELAAMKEIIEGLTWMTPATKQKALEKLATFNPKVGYPDRWRDYSSVSIGRDSFWANVVAANTFNTAVVRARIGKPTDRGLWGMTPPTSNAYYNPLLNEIVFPAGILVPPAFDAAASEAYNYGGIGVVIGHEISHGFDDQGAQYDAQGRLENWWSEADLKAFTERGQCVVDQFEGYFIEPGLHHQGKLVLGESIGDLAGARIAWLAYQKALKAHPETPNDGFTAAQEFFVAWGQFRGDAIRPETQRLMVQGDPHPVAKYRVIGPLSNSPEFQQAFACKDDAPMVRAAATRCQVW